ncbi:MAG TPA: 16S rRNA (guanine(966)-N(2))-methyltransferase RsmD [Rectinemataceae bacterium]|nr:16S rRNA (guanine(966)-N(2))-methyltransferase RsmD [Rectinemataceae bacterium]
MRITGGIYCGRTIELPTGQLAIRPAMDRMRESVFAVLGDLTGLSFLDLFSGSGIIALEAASRGADPVTCVERDRAKFPLLLKNVSIAEQRIECKAQPVELFLARNRSPFDIAFLDPPFPYAYKLDLLKNLGTGPTLKDGGLVLIHFPKEDRLPPQVGRLVCEDERVYGRSIVRFYRKKTDI